MKLKHVYSSPKLSELYLVKSLLENAGIKVEVFDENIGTIAPHHLFGTSGPQLMVTEDQWEEAKKIVQDFIDKND